MDREEFQAEVRKKQREREVMEMQSILSTYAGRMVLWRLMSKCSIYGSSFVGEKPLEMAHNEGKRAVGLEILNEVFTADPEAYTRMRAEAAWYHAAKEQELEGNFDDSAG